MIRILLTSRRFTGLICIILMAIEALRHLLFLVGFLPYQALWGTAVKVNTSIIAGEVISCIMLWLFVLSLIVLTRHRFIHVRRLPDGRKRRSLKRVSGFTVLLCRIASITALLLFVGYLRTDALSLRIGMGIYMMILFVLLIIFQHDLSRDNRRAQQYFKKLKMRRQQKASKI